MAGSIKNILSFNNIRHLEPKKSNLFTMVFENLPLNKDYKENLQMNLIKASRPEISVDTMNMPRLNMKYIVASGAKGGMAGTMDVTFRDVIQYETSRLLYEWMTLIFDRQTGAMGYSAAYKTNADVILLDPMGVEIERWRYEGIFPTDLKLGDLEYTDSPSELKVDATFAYDLAYLVSTNTQVGPNQYGWQEGDSIDYTANPGGRHVEDSPSNVSDIELPT